MHKLQCGAWISDSVYAQLEASALRGRSQKPQLIPSLHLVLVERPCWDAMIGLRPTGGRLNLHGEPVNRVEAHVSRPKAKATWEWRISLVGHARDVIAIGGFKVCISERDQAHLRGKMLDLLDGKLVALPASP
jgi:hypothetical protein